MRACTDENYLGIVERLRKQAVRVQTMYGEMASQQIEWLAADAIEKLLSSPGPSQCPNIVTSDEGTSYCRLAQDGGITQALVAMARANAIEECAKVAEDEWVSANSLCRSKAAGDIAKAIRAIDSPPATSENK